MKITIILFSYRNIKIGSTANLFETIVKIFTKKKSNFYEFENL